MSRLCMVLHAGFPNEVRVAAEARAAIAAGFEVDVVALRRPGQHKEEICEGARVFRLPIRHLHGRSGLEFFLEYVWFALLSTFRVTQLGLRRRYDVVQIHNPP